MNKFYDMPLVKPYWRSNVMRDETVLFVRYDEVAPAYGYLAYTPKSILKVQNYGEDITLEEGKDYVLEGKKLIRKDDSIFPCLNFTDLIGSGFPAGNHYPVKPELVEDGNNEVFYTEGPTLPWHTVKVTYEYDPAELDFTTAYKGDKLPKTMERIRMGSLRALIYGDSVATGCSSSGYMGIMPFMHDWYDLFFMGLESRYGVKVTSANTAVGGKDSNWGLINVQENVIDQAPELVILRFGANDGGFNILENGWEVPPADFKTRIRGIIDETRAALDHDVEFILMDTMRTNPYSTLSNLQGAYPAMLVELENELTGVIHCDVQKVQDELLGGNGQKGGKLYADLLVNNINHPNDFMLRVQAMLLLEQLIPYGA